MIKEISERELQENWLYGCLILLAYFPYFEKVEVGL
jgi:hypothetical protein